ncbi:MAG: glutamate--tRNA ligase [Armatimonadetes bacterium]|nr:glutamate--tRNA ligase [Armatimonadota bacterium]
MKRTDSRRLPVSEVRTRFAPSPTGYFHVGGARTALFSWLYARQQGGQFVLRIEDTDKERSTDESIRIILDGMAWLGLEWDEGPIYQSHNLREHVTAAERLVETGHAYRCYATTAEIGATREAAKAAGDPSWKYRGPDSVIAVAEQERRATAGEPFVVRFRVPREAGPIAFGDEVYGEQSVDPNELDDFVLLRNDGSPLYMLSVVCDDLTARITHVIRGQDHLSNTPKQILLYRALGADEPRFAHLPLIMAANGEKMSKRKHGDVVSVTTYRDRGFLPEAFINFVALLGWSPAEGEEREIFSLSEMVERFRFDRVNRSNAKFVFDPHDPRQWTDAKAQSINATWIRTMPLADLLPYVEATLREAGLWDESFGAARREWFERTVELIRERFWTLLDFVEQGAAYFGDEVRYEPKAVAKNLRKTPALASALPALAVRLEGLEPFAEAEIEEIVRAVAEEHGLSAGAIINGLRTAVSGQAVGPGAFVLCVAVGRERVVERLRRAPELVGGEG